MEKRQLRHSFCIPIAALAAFLPAACVPIAGPVVSAPNGMAEQAAPTAETPPQEDKGARGAPIQVTYITPTQTEGPFYPVNKPLDRDNDLFVLAGAEGRPAGKILEFGGRLYDGSGRPAPGAVIEIWQTDDNGVYLHPRDPGISRRDVNFQSYGEAVTAEDGSYRFRTILPGRYAPRPRHIHVKIRLGKRALLTTQFYFDNDPELATDPIFADATDEKKALIMAVEEGVDMEGNPILIGERDIVLRGKLSE